MSPRTRAAALYAVAWIPFTALYALALGASRLMPVAEAIRSAVFSMLPAALLGILALRAADGIARREWRRRRALAAHLVLAVAYAVLWLAAVLGQIVLFATREARDYFLPHGLVW